MTPYWWTTSKYTHTLRSIILCDWNRLKKYIYIYTLKNNCHWTRFSFVIHKFIWNSTCSAVHHLRKLIMNINSAHRQTKLGYFLFTLLTTFVGLTFLSFFARLMYFFTCSVVVVVIFLIFFYLTYFQECKVTNIPTSKRTNGKIGVARLW